MTRMFLTLAALIGLAVAPAPARADNAKLEGDWEGSLKVSEDVSLRLVFHIKKEAKKAGKEAETYSATWDSPDQGAKGLKVDSVKFEKGEATLAMKGARAEFVGKLGDDGKSLDGTFTQGGKKTPLKLAPAAKGEAKPKPDQMWEGKIQVQAGLELRVVLNLFKQKDGTFKATMDSLDQNVEGIKVDSVSLGKEKLTFEVKLIKGEFSGELNEAKTEAKGEWKQGGASMPLTLKKTDKITELRRTQMPKGPFPYREIEVVYPNKAAEGVELAGTLTLPDGDGPFPVVILISGSGAQDRDESLLGHKPFLVLADYLTRRGIGVLRFDDRGMGKSSGKHAVATSADFATDVQAGVDFLKARKDVDVKRIGLMGHSEGGLIAPMVAAKNPEEIAFLVLLAGPGVPGDEILREQGALIAKAGGASEKMIGLTLAMSKKVFDVVRAEKDETAAKAKILAVVAEMLKGLSDEDRKALGDDASEKAIEGQIAMINSPWFRFFLSYDPRPALAKVKCPVLAINGEKDLQVPPSQSLPEIEKAVKSGGNDKVTIKEMPGLNHLFQASKTGSPAEYAKIEETFNPAALQVVGDWIAGLN